MDKKELKTFIVQHNQIHHFCLEILKTLEHDYPDVLGPKQQKGRLNQHFP